MAAPSIVQVSASSDRRRESRNDLVAADVLHLRLDHIPNSVNKRHRRKRAQVMSDGPYRRRGYLGEDVSGGVCRRVRKDYRRKTLLLGNRAQGRKREHLLLPHALKLLQQHPRLRLRLPKRGK